MTPQEKAKELRDKFQDRLFDKRHVTIYQEDAVECALITVDEIIKTLKDNDLYIGGETNIDEIIIFWQEVKRELAEI
jgi:hypothetical protein